MAMSVSPRVSQYLSEEQSKSSGDVATEWTELESLYIKKLWHQLTLRLLDFVKNSIFSTGDGLIRMYSNFIADFEHRINPLALCEIVMFIVNQIQEPKEAIEFLEKMKEKVKSHEQANILCSTAIGLIRLKQKDMPQTKIIIESVESQLDDMDGVTPVHARFYELSSNYHKLMGNHAEYYKQALRYLGCMDIADIPAEEQVDRAFNLSLAALLGPNVYNFGELLAHPILATLKLTDKAWLVELVYAFNSGSLAKFENLREHWQKQPDLKSQELPLRQKICLLALMEMTFKRPANHRQLTFDEISKETQLPINGVELFVMKALSLGLVKGSIDQVDEKVQMTWVQPRVLDVDQISNMQKRMQEWCSDVQTMEMFVEDKARDILT